jgi:stage III sporulation protein AA
MNNCVKHIGINLMIRSMGPEIISTDEIGGENDFNAIKDAVYSGVKLLLTAHGNDIEDVSKDFINNFMFKNIVVLTKKEKPAEIKKIYTLEDKEYVLNS